MPGFDSRCQQMLAVAQPVDDTVAYDVVSELPCLSRAGGYEAERSALGGFRDHPFVVRRQGRGQSLADAGGWRTISIAYEHGIVRATAVAFLFEDNLVAVAADITGDRPAKPAEFMLLFTSGGDATNPKTLAMRHHQRDFIPQVLEPYSSGHIGNGPQLA